MRKKNKVPKKKITTTGNGRRKGKKIGRKAGPIAKAQTKRKVNTSSSSLSVIGSLKESLAAQAKAHNMGNWKSFATSVLEKAAAQQQA